MCDEPIKLLILGNGFDLAHKVPTRYKDFLEFCKQIEALYSFESKSYDLDFKKKFEKNCNEYLKDYINNWKIDQTIKDKFHKAFEEKYYIGGASKTKVFEEIYECLSKNIWYSYFCNIYKTKGENWIDFESEISYIIQFIDKNTNNLLDLTNTIHNTDNLDEIEIFFKSSNKFIPSNYFNINILRKNLFNDLEKLTRALELYLSHFVEKLKINVISDDIAEIKPDYVINFNYTDTYERLYNSKDIFYIHGKCYENKSAEDNNMVLGIDEYWSEPECDIHTNFAIFKKFVQRIRKKTGIKHCEYLSKINNLYKNKKKVSQVYIFGHSLDITDKDILLDFFNSKAIKVTIYCVDYETEGKLIANTIKIIGEKSLLTKVNQAEPQIEFKIQKEMIPKP